MARPGVKVRAWLFLDARSLSYLSAPAATHDVHHFLFEHWLELLAQNGERQRGGGAGGEARESFIHKANCWRDFSETPEVSVHINDGAILTSTLSSFHPKQQHRKASLNRNILQGLVI